MRLTFIQLTSVFISLIVILYACKDTKQPINSVVAGSPNSEKTAIDSFIAQDSMHRLYASWFNEMHLEKPIKAYLEFLRNADIVDKNSERESGFLSDIQDVKLSESNRKKSFQEFIKDIQVLPLKDGYMLIKGKEYDHSGPPFVFAIFNKTDNLLPFSSPFADGYEDEFPFRTSHDSIRLEDWNKDGNLELLVERIYGHGKAAFDEHKVNMEVYDFTSTANKIIQICDYELEESVAYHHYDIGIETFKKSEGKIFFMRSDLLKLVTRMKTGVSYGEELDSTHSQNEIERRIEFKKEYEAKPSQDSTIVTYFQQNKVTKIYEAVKK